MKLLRGTSIPYLWVLLIKWCVQSFQGGFDYKKAIVDTIITIIEENSDAKEAGKYNDSLKTCISKVKYNLSS